MTICAPATACPAFAGLCPPGTSALHGCLPSFLGTGTSDRSSYCNTCCSLGVPAVCTVCNSSARHRYRRMVQRQPVDTASSAIRSGTLALRRRDQANKLSFHASPVHHVSHTSLPRILAARLHLLLRQHGRGQGIAVHSSSFQLALMHAHASLVASQTAVPQSAGSVVIWCHTCIWASEPGHGSSGAHAIYSCNGMSLRQNERPVIDMPADAQAAESSASASLLRPECAHSAGTCLACAMCKQAALHAAAASTDPQVHVQVPMLGGAATDADD